MQYIYIYISYVHIIFYIYLYLQGLEISMLVSPLWPEMPQAFNVLGKLPRVASQYGGELCGTLVDLKLFFNHVLMHLIFLRTRGHLHVIKRKHLIFKLPARALFSYTCIYIYMYLVQFIPIYVHMYQKIHLGRYEDSKGVKKFVGLKGNLKKSG